MTEPVKLWRGPCVVDGLPARGVITPDGRKIVEEFRDGRWVLSTTTWASELAFTPEASANTLAQFGVPASDVRGADL